MEKITIKMSELEGTKTKHLVDYLVEKGIAAIPEGYTRMNTPIAKMEFTNGKKCIDGDADLTNLYLYFE